MTTEYLTKTLLNTGEKMTREELEWCLNALTGENGLSEDETGAINSSFFAENILGFDDDIKIHRALSVTTNIEFYKYKVDFKLYQ